MAQETSKSGSMTPEVKQALVIAAVVIGLLLAGWSGYRTLRGPQIEVVGTLSGEAGKAELMKGQNEAAKR